MSKWFSYSVCGFSGKQQPSFGLLPQPWWTPEWDRSAARKLQRKRLLFGVIGNVAAAADGFDRDGGVVIA